MTILAEHLNDHFYPVVDLGQGLFRCADEMPNATWNTYFLIGQAVTPFLISQNHVDDSFARDVLTTAGFQPVDRLELSALPANRYDLTHLLRVPHDYHRELMGRLDQVRSQTTLCIPIHREEFTGNESAQEFQALRNSVVATADWERAPAPKISLRFANTRTGAGTRGDGYVFVKLDLLLREIQELAGDSGGFIEVINYCGNVAELRSKSPDSYLWIDDRQNASALEVARSDAASRMIEFLKAG